MAWVLSAPLVLAQGEGAGRGENPSDAGGFLIIAGTIVVAVVVVVAVCYLLARLTARRRERAPRAPGREG